MGLDSRPARSRPAPRPDRAPVDGGARAHATQPELDGLAVPGLGTEGDPGVLTEDGVLRLQRLAGNAAVRSVLASPRPTVQRWGIALGGWVPAHPELREGATGEAVRELQEKLSLATAAGGPLVADGQFGPATRRRIRAFRAANGLGNSPVADAALWTALDNAVANLPAPVRPVLGVGDSGPDVALAQQKLNSIAGAGAPLPIDGQFTVVMGALIMAFQAGQHLTVNGRLDAPTWTALDRAVAGGGTRLEGGTPVEQHVRNSAGASPLGQPIAGSSLHVVVGSGGLQRGPAVREFQQKLNAWRATQVGLAPIDDDGRWGTDTRNATVAFQAATPGLAPGNGIGDIATWTALDAIVPTVAVGYRERQWREEVGGATYGMTNAGRGGSRYAWEIRGRDIHVTSKVRFTGAAPPGAWFGHVRRAWNIYKAVREGTDESLLINFDMVSGSGGDSRAVRVVAPPATGRANAGTWYVADTDAANTVPHEFGHLIGLRDEYQLHPGDFRAITGREPDVGATTGPVGVTPLTIATNLRAAMMARNTANAFTAVAGVQAGAFAQQVVAQYATLGAATVPAVVAAPGVAPLAAVPLTTNLVRDLEAALVENANLDKYNTIQVLTYTSGSMMGDPTRAFDPHDHGVQARHVQEFVDVIQQVRGGRWHAELR
jgi:peptidoglycan hydrolase-like protein with peptidoglycan-binding domain